MMSKQQSKSFFYLFRILLFSSLIAFPLLPFSQREDNSAWAQAGLTIVPEDRRFQNQDFSQSLFWYVPWWDNACRFYNLPPYCSYQRTHKFNDATLIMEADSTAYAKATLKLKDPVSVSESLRYGKILSRGYMNLTAPTSRTTDKIVYDETNPEMGGGSILELSLTPTGQVKTITYTVSTP